MKTIHVIILAIIITALIACGLPPVAATTDSADVYPLTAVVSDFDRENDIVVCKDYAGNLWEFEGCEDWMLGDIASLLVNDCGTISICDDVIEIVRYGGHLEEEW